MDDYYSIRHSFNNGKCSLVVVDSDTCPSLIVLKKSWSIKDSRLLSIFCLLEFIDCDSYPPPDNHRNFRLASYLTHFCTFAPWMMLFEFHIWVSFSLFVIPIEWRHLKLIEYSSYFFKGGIWAGGFLSTTSYESINDVGFWWVLLSRRAAKENLTDWRKNLSIDNV